MYCIGATGKCNAKSQLCAWHVVSSLYFSSSERVGVGVSRTLEMLLKPHTAYMFTGVYRMLQPVIILARKKG